MTPRQIFVPSLLLLLAASRMSRMPNLAATGPNGAVPIAMAWGTKRSCFANGPKMALISCGKQITPGPVTRRWRSKMVASLHKVI